MYHKTTETHSVQAERREARMAELDVAHNTEANQLRALLAAAQRKLYVSKTRTKG